MNGNKFCISFYHTLHNIWLLKYNSNLFDIHRICKIYIVYFQVLADACFDQNIYYKGDYCRIYKNIFLYRIYIVCIQGISNIVRSNPYNNCLLYDQKFGLGIVFRNFGTMQLNRIRICWRLCRLYLYYSVCISMIL